MTNIAVGVGNTGRGTTAASAGVSITGAQTSGTNAIYVTVLTSYPVATAYNTVSVSDGTNGSYTRIGTTITGGSTSAPTYLDRFIFVGNATASLTVTASASGTPNWSINVVEITSSSVTPLVATGAGSANSFAAKPYPTGTINVGVPGTSGTLLLGTVYTGVNAPTWTLDSGSNPTSGWTVTPASNVSTTWSFNSPGSTWGYVLTGASGISSAQLELQNGNAANSYIGVLDAFAGGTSGGGGGTTALVIQRRKKPFYFFFNRS